MARIPTGSPIALAAALVVAAACTGAVGAGPAEQPRQVRIDAAIAAAEEFLAGQIGPDGRCAGEFAPDNPRFGGKTGLCLYALLSASREPPGGPAKRALAWLTAAKLTGTYAVAMRACALAALSGEGHRERLADDVQWLVRAASRKGAYSYTSYADGEPQTAYDNSNSQMAVLGVWAGAGRGVEVPETYWRNVERHWTDDQHDGGWGYHTRAGAARSKTYGSMTAAGLATMYACFDKLHAGQFVRCVATERHKPIEDGLKWLAENFSAEVNPRLGANWLYYWLFCVERVGLASGMKHFGRHDWYSEGVESLLETQNGDGSFSSGDRTAQTAFALLFLVGGRNPVLFSKLRYKGKWNARPRDLANLTRFINHTFERPVAWQVLDADAPVSDWHDAPVLYISGAGPCTITDAQIERIRTFVQRGGMILSEAACSSGSFTLDMQRIYKRLFPEYPLKGLADDHPVYNLNFTPAGAGGLAGVSNGVRMLAIHAPRELSLALQMARASDKPTFELLGNIYLFATDKGMLRPRGAPPWPAPKKFTPRRVLKVARVRYKGNYDPEPLAWKRLAVVMGNRYAIRLVVDGPMDIVALDPEKHPVAAMTGTGAFTLSDGDLTLLKHYLASGGTLLVDAAGGARQFAQAVEKQILPLAGGGQARLIASHVILGGPAKIKQVNYRRDFTLALGAARHESRLRGVLARGRLAIVYSSEDLTAGLGGYPGYRLRGYSPDSAVDVVTNILCHLDDARRAAGKRPAPATGPAP